MKLSDVMLPQRPERLAQAPVAVWSAPVVLPTWLPEQPDQFPAFLDQRVYQGASGRVFPLPFHDRIADTPIDREWVGLHLENEYLRVLVLPELGGRIHYAFDRRTGESMFYANPVIKPALVALAGPWLAGGIEFNWPQHHRPATFLPTAWQIDEQTGTAWCSDHDPFARMKGMHGVRLHPGSTLLEVSARLYNRGDQIETFHWWANVAAEVNDNYQSFFPADVTMVADHAKRAVTTFPASDGVYYGIDYSQRVGQDTAPGSDLVVPGDRLDWPRTIPVPTSYMCLGSTQDHFGGYDHGTGAGFVHWADHHVVNGKKQWTWGNHEFGRRWNRNLAQGDAEYIELMAGAYTENQPDFSHLAPGETKTFSQFWYPIVGTGAAVTATRDAALGADLSADAVRLRLDATSDLGTPTLTVTAADGTLLHQDAHRFTPVDPIRLELPGAEAVVVELTDGDRILLDWDSAQTFDEVELKPAQATIPPAEIASVEELYLTGRHLAQYRHANRMPEPYWEEALARDPGHAASHVGLADRLYRRGQFELAEPHLRAAIDRLTMLNPNPETGDAHYLLGLTLVRLGRDQDAYAAFAKSAWLQAWAAPANYECALIDACAGRTAEALRRVEDSLRIRGDQLQARNLKVILLRRLGRTAEADALLADTLALDPVDLWARQLAGQLLADQGQTEAQALLDVALDTARTGDLAAAIELCEQARVADAGRPLGQTACGVLADYHAARFADLLGDGDAATALRSRAASGDRTWNFASRLDDVDALQAALVADADDATSAALLGHWLYAHDRREEAVQQWRHSIELDPTDPVVWRNLGVAAHNLDQDVEAATAAYARAQDMDPANARLLYEADQLRRRTGAPLDQRVEALEAAPEAIASRDDLSVEYANLLVSLGRAGDAVDVLAGRVFQPWEGGEGMALGAWDRAHHALADQALRAGDAQAAVSHVQAALNPPESLGEVRHPLASPAALLVTLGDGLAALGRTDEARQAWTTAASATGDFSKMAPTDFSENTYHSIEAARRLGDADREQVLTSGLAGHVESFAVTPAQIDFFATSMPTLLLFTEDLNQRRDLTATLLGAQLALLAGDRDAAAAALEQVLAIDPAHELAGDQLLRLHPQA